MAFSHGTPNSIVTDGLVFCVDPANVLSWSGPDSSNVNDLINTNNGTIYNDTSGSYGDNNSFAFDGTDDYIEIPNNSSLQITSNLTLSCWVKAGNVSGTNSIIDKFYDGTDRSYMLRITSTTIRLSLGNTDGSSSIEYRSTAVLSNNIWYYITTTFSSTDNEVKIYINDSLDSTHSKTNLISSNTQPLRIGSGYNLLNDFNGNISQVQIYNRALSAQEVLQNYNALKNRFRT